ncbi:hypothetical protein MKW98_028007, partial [Papaver atlanticum]
MDVDEKVSRIEKTKATCVHVSKSTNESKEVNSAENISKTTEINSQGFSHLYQVKMLMILKINLVLKSIRGGGGLKPIVVTGNPPTFVSALSRRIIAAGDLHGDIAQTRSALEMAGVLSSDGWNTWTGEETVLVQLGDILDRGEDEIVILSLLKSLHIQAKAKGGAVFQ